MPETNETSQQQFDMLMAALPTVTQAVEKIDALPSNEITATEEDCQKMTRLRNALTNLITKYC